MDHLSSCYFCSSALGEPLETYAVSGSGGETAVTLCSTCQRKLDLIFDATGSTSVEVLDQNEMGPGNSSSGDAVEPAPSTSESVSTDEEPADTQTGETDGSETPNTTEPIPLGEDIVADAGGSPVEADEMAEADDSSMADLGDDLPTDEAADDQSQHESGLTEEFRDDDAETPDVGASEEYIPEEASDGVDQSILEADDIATGDVDIDDALGDASDGDLDDADSRPDTDELGDIEAPDKQQVDGESEESHQPTGVINDIIGELDDEIENIGTDADAVNPDDTEETEQEGGFAFDQGSESEDSQDSQDDEITAKMEPDIPDEFDTGGDTDSISFGDESDGAADEQAAVDEGTATDDTTETVDPSSSADRADSAESPEPDEQPSSTSDAAAEQSQPSISALEYNKVMRLLQNREFPIDRDEIVAVAANAYELSEADCTAVIELAIDRGLLAADGDVLIRPD